MEREIRVGAGSLQRSDQRGLRGALSPETKAEGFTQITWEIEPSGPSFSRLTVTHDVEGAPILAGMVGSKFSEQGTGGWSWILSDLKTLLETGSNL